MVYACGIDGHTPYGEEDVNSWDNRRNKDCYKGRNEKQGMRKGNIYL